MAHGLDGADVVTFHELLDFSEHVVSLLFEQRAPVDDRSPVLAGVPHRQGGPLGVKCGTLLCEFLVDSPRAMAMVLPVFSIAGDILGKNFQKARARVGTV